MEHNFRLFQTVTVDPNNRVYVERRGAPRVFVGFGTVVFTFESATKTFYAVALQLANEEIFVTIFRTLKFDNRRPREVFERIFTRNVGKITVERIFANVRPDLNLAVITGQDERYSSTLWLYKMTTGEILYTSTSFSDVQMVTIQTTSMDILGTWGDRPDQIYTYKYVGHIRRRELRATTRTELSLAADPAIVTIDPANPFNFLELPSEAPIQGTAFPAGPGLTVLPVGRMLHFVYVDLLEVAKGDADVEPQIIPAPTFQEFIRNFFVERQLDVQSNLSVILGTLSYMWPPEIVTLTDKLTYIAAQMPPWHVDGRWLIQDLLFLHDAFEDCDVDRVVDPHAETIGIVGFDRKLICINRTTVQDMTDAERGELGIVGTLPDNTSFFYYVNRARQLVAIDAIFAENEFIDELLLHWDSPQLKGLFFSRFDVDDFLYTRDTKEDPHFDISGPNQAAIILYAARYKEFPLEFMRAVLDFYRSDGSVVRRLIEEYSDNVDSYHLPDLIPMLARHVLTPEAYDSLASRVDMTQLLATREYDIRHIRFTELPKYNELALLPQAFIRWQIHHHVANSLQFNLFRDNLLVLPENIPDALHTHFRFAFEHFLVSDGVNIMNDWGDAAVIFAAWIESRAAVRRLVEYLVENEEVVRRVMTYPDRKIYNRLYRLFFQQSRPGTRDDLRDTLDQYRINMTVSPTADEVHSIIRQENVPLLQQIVTVSQFDAQYVLDYAVGNNALSVISHFITYDNARHINPDIFTRVYKPPGMDVLNIILPYGFVLPAASPHYPQFSPDIQQFIDHEEPPAMTSMQATQFIAVVHPFVFLINRALQGQLRHMNHRVLQIFANVAITDDAALRFAREGTTSFVFYLFPGIRFPNTVQNLRHIFETLGNEEGLAQLDARTG